MDHCTDLMVIVRIINEFLWFKIWLKIGLEYRKVIRKYMENN